MPETANRKHSAPPQQRFVNGKCMIPLSKLCKNFHTNMSPGLTSEQAKQILIQSGKNAFHPPSSSIRDSFREKLGSPYGEIFTLVG